MKKILFLLAILPMMVFTACSSDDNTEEIADYSKKIVGVWESGNTLVSFDGNGYYSAILDETFMDCGSYSVSGDNVYCTNAYLNKNTTYKISNINNSQITINAKYINFKGESKQIDVSLNKTSRKPATKEHVLVGKKYFFMLNSYGICFVQFDSYNTAKMQTDELNPNVQAWNYFYIEPYIYSQKYKDDMHGLSLFYQECGKGKICKEKVEIGNNGEIEDIDLLNI